MRIPAPKFAMCRERLEWRWRSCAEEGAIQTVLNPERFRSEEAVQFGVDFGDDFTQVFWIVLEIEIVYRDHQDLAFGVG